MENYPLIFDWGDTLMEVLPGMEGAMVYWPKVQAVNGAWNTLDRLSKIYPCYVATNAEDSSAIEVQAALARADLDRFISGIFTKTEIGFRKSNPEFYRSISSRLNVPPGQMIMIGDDFEQDVLSAHRAGLFTVWLNSKGNELTSCLPYQDAEILWLDGISRVMETKFPPTIETCNIWLEENQVPDNIRSHMQAVADYAYKLAVNLQNANVDVDPILVHRGAWLHDIGKLHESKSNLDHGAVGANILRRKGEEILAEIIEKHAVESILKEPFHEWSWNTKIVYYVDKLFDGETHMDIVDRLSRLGLRYPKSNKEFEKALPLIIALEKEIKLLLSPD